MANIGVLYFIDALHTGGTEVQLQGLCRHLDRSIFSPYVCTIRDFDQSLVPVTCPLQSYDVPKLISGSTLNCLRDLKRFQREKNIRVAQTFFHDATVIGGLAAKLGRVPVRIGSFRDMGFWRDRTQAMLGRMVYPMMTGFIANSNAVRDHAYGFSGVRKNSIAMIPNGIDVDRFPPQRDKPGEISVAIVGNFNRRVKRTDLFIRAAGEVAQKFPQVKWYVVGEGHLEPELRRLADSVGVAPRMTFTGRLADIPEFLKQIHIGVNCSDSEGFSNAITEYMLSNCTVVATSVGGNKEAVRDGETGLLVAPDNASALGAALVTLLENPAKSREMAMAAHQFAARELSWGTCIGKHQAYYLSELTKHDRSFQG